MPERNQFRVGGRLRVDGERQAPNGDDFDIRFVAATEQLASDGGIIPVRAWHLDRFKTNPRFISNHDLQGWMGGITDTVVGTVVDIRIEDGLPEDMAPGGKGLVAYVRFAHTEFANEMRTLYMDGDLDAVSVQWDWRTHKERSPTDEEIEEHGVKLSWVATRADLLEISSVIVGADPGALALRGRVGEAMALCRSKGIELPKIDEILKRNEDKPPPASDKIRDDATQIDQATESLSARMVDDGALADAISSLRRTLEAWDLWVLQGFEVREGLGDVANAFSALIAGDEVGEDIKVEERSLGDIIDRVREMVSIEELQGAFDEFHEKFSAQMAVLSGDDEVDPNDVYEDKDIEVVEDESDIDVDDVYEEQKEEEEPGDAEDGVKAADSDKLEDEDPEKNTAAKDTDDQEGGEEKVKLAAIFGSDQEGEADKAA